MIGARENPVLKSRVRFDAEASTVRVDVAGLTADEAHEAVALGIIEASRAVVRRARLRRFRSPSTLSLAADNRTFVITDQRGRAAAIEIDIVPYGPTALDGHEAGEELESRVVTGISAVLRPLGYRVRQNEGPQ